MFLACFLFLLDFDPLRASSLRLWREAWHVGVNGQKFHHCHRAVPREQVSFLKQGWNLRRLLQETAQMYSISNVIKKKHSKADFLNSIKYKKHPVKIGMSEKWKCRTRTITATIITTLSTTTTLTILWPLVVTTDIKLSIWKKYKGSVISKFKLRFLHEFQHAHSCH